MDSVTRVEAGAGIVPFWRARFQPMRKSRLQEAGRSALVCISAKSAVMSRRCVVIRSGLGEAQRDLTGIVLLLNGDIF